MIERTTVRLPEDLLDRARRKAAADGRTLTSLIEEGLQLVLTENRLAKTAERVMPRVSRAAGGLMPGIDLTDAAALQELEDKELAERMKRFE